MIKDTTDMIDGFFKDAATTTASSEPAEPLTYDKLINAMSLISENDKYAIHGKVKTDTELKQMMGAAPTKESPLPGSLNFCGFNIYLDDDIPPGIMRVYYNAGTYEDFEI